MQNNNSFFIDNRGFLLNGSLVVIGNDYNVHRCVNENTIYENTEAFIHFKKEDIKIPKEIVEQCYKENVKISIQHWNSLTILKNRDGKKVIKFPLDGINEIKKIGFRMIPGFTRYHINENGIVINTATKFISTPYLGNSGYLMYGLTPDVGNRTIIGLHRLLGLAFLDYDADIDIRVINHKDGVKLHNWLGNLEFVTYSENLNHAFKNGLRTDNCFVEVRNVETNTVETFYSISEAAKNYNLTTKNLDYRLKKPENRVYDGKFQFRKKSDLAWDNVSIFSKQSKAFIVKNKETLEEIEVSSLSNASRFLNMGVATLYWRIKNKGFSEDNKFLCKPLVID